MAILKDSEDAISEKSRPFSFPLTNSDPLDLIKTRPNDPQPIFSEFKFFSEKLLFLTAATKIFNIYSVLN